MDIRRDQEGSWIRNCIHILLGILREQMSIIRKSSRKHLFRAVRNEIHEVLDRKKRVRAVANNNQLPSNLYEK